jgi:hypothetical protein
MRQTTMSIPEVGLMAATRGMLGAGAALLLADRVAKDKRKVIGWPLLAIGALSTIPLAMRMIKHSHPSAADIANNI